MIDSGTLITIGLWVLVAGVFPAIMMLADLLLGKLEQFILWVCDHANRHF